MNTFDHSELSVEEARVAGEVSERERIIKLLAPHAQHDEEMCYAEGKRECYPEDCSAPLVQWLIQEILKTNLQNNVNISEHNER